MAGYRFGSNSKRDFDASGQENEHVDFSNVPSSLFGFGVFVGLVDLLAIRGYWRLKPKLRRAGALQRGALECGGWTPLWIHIKNEVRRCAFAEAARNVFCLSNCLISAVGES